MQVLCIRFDFFINFVVDNKFWKNTNNTNMIKKILTLVLIMLSVIGVSAQQVTTIEDLRAGVARGDEYSILMLGWCYANGEGVDKNMATAIGFWRQLGEKESGGEYVATACYMLGNCYSEGNGVPLDINTAVYWWRKAAGLGNEKAKDMLSKNPDVTAQAPQSGQSKVITIPGTNVSFKMIYVQGGTFKMGAQKTNSVGENFDYDAGEDETPIHSVTLSDYYLGEFEVTQGVWEAVMGFGGRLDDGFYMRPFADVWLGSDPTTGYGKGSNYPAYYVSYEDIVNHFIPRLNKLTGMNFRLPTEAEWEYAARGGKNQDYYLYSGSDNLNDVAWYTSNSSSSTHPVGTKKPNSLGIYDMSGNVWEWCSDWYGNYSTSSQTNPTGPTSGSNRVLRGGCWYYNAQNCRVANRSGSNPGIRNYNLGFRLACGL